MNYRTKRKLRRISLKAQKFISDNKFCLAQISFMVLPMLISGTCDASTSTKTISAIQGPADFLAEALTGPIAKTCAIIAVGGSGLAWGMGLEQQITKTGCKLTGGCGLAVGAGNVYNDVFGETAGCIFM